MLFCRQSVKILTYRIYSQIGPGRILRNSDSVFVARRNSKVVLDTWRHVGYLEASFLQVLYAFGPGLPVHFTFLNNVIQNGAATIVFWWQPGQLSGGLGYIGGIQSTNGTRCVCTEVDIYLLGGTKVREKNSFEPISWLSVLTEDFDANKHCLLSS